MKKILSIIAIAFLAISVVFTSCRNDASNAQSEESTEQTTPAEETTTQEQAAPAQDQATETQEATNAAAADTTQAQWIYLLMSQKAASFREAAFFFVCPVWAISQW